MTKTEFVNQPVDELRAALLEIFEDDGSLAEASKTDLQKFARDNWDDIDPEVNGAEEEVAEQGGLPDPTELDPTQILEYERPLEYEGDLAITHPTEGLIPVDPDPDDLSTPNPRTDLYTGRMRPNEDPTVNTDITNQPGVEQGTVVSG